MFSVRVDDHEVRDFLRIAPAEQRRAVRSFLRRGALYLEGQQRRDAARRFGVETGESRMQTVDPSRPKGIWSASVTSRITAEQAEVGPSVRAYAWWVEQGSEAPRGVPRSHRRSSFRGHRVVERSAEEGRGRLLEFWRGEVADALGRST